MDIQIEEQTLWQQTLWQQTRVELEAARQQVAERVRYDPKGHR